MKRNTAQSSQRESISTMLAEIMAWQVGVALL